VATTLEARIRERAYFLSQSGGGADDGTHFWLIAEREVLAEVAMESAANSQPSETVQLAQAAKPIPVLHAATPVRHPEAKQPKKAARKPRTATQSVKTSAKATALSTAAESPAGNSATTPIKPGADMRARPGAVRPHSRARGDSIALKS
jgi:hypothetical protein